MATNFDIEYSGMVTPIESITAADGSDVAEILASRIDRTFGSTIRKTMSTTSTDVKFKESYSTTTSLVSIEHSTIFNAQVVSDFLMAIIYKERGSSTPDAIFTFESGDAEVVKLIGVNDFFIMPLNGLDGANVKVKSSGTETRSEIHLLCGDQS